MMFYDNVFKCLFILYVNIFVQSTELWDIRTLNKFIIVIIY